MDYRRVWGATSLEGQVAQINQLHITFLTIGAPSTMEV